MTKNNRYISLLEKLLTHLKNAKLEYLKAADTLIDLKKRDILINRLY